MGVVQRLPVATAEGHDSGSRIIELWPDLLERTCRACDTDAAALVMQRSHGAAMEHAAGFAPEAVARFNERFAVDEGCLAVDDMLRQPGHIVTDPAAAAGNGAGARLDEWLAPQGLAHTALAFVARDRDGLLLMMLARSAVRGPFTADILARVSAALPALASTWVLDRLATATASRLSVASALLDQWSHGIIVIDGNGRVLTRNSTARAILEARDGLSIRDGRLAAVRSRDAAMLRRAFDDLTGAGPVGEPIRSKAVAISRGGDNEALHLILTRLPFGDGDNDGTPAFAIFLSNAGGADAPPQEWLRDLFGLSRVDAEITRLLCQGLTTDEIARRLHASPHTVRAHLKRIFLKMDVNRQTDVVRVVVGGIGPVNAGRADRPAAPDAG